jgi:hypothetical protein
MTADSREPFELRSFQRAAVDDFFSAGGGAVRVLAAPTGTGKTTTAVAIVDESIRRGAQAILILSTHLLVAQQIAERAETSMLATVELRQAVAVSTSAGIAPTWPPAILVFGSLQQAAREPIAEALMVGRWDLVVADDAVGLAADEANKLVMFLDSAQVERALIVQDAPLPGGPVWPRAAPLSYPFPSIPSEGPPEIEFSVAEYERSGIELDLAQRAQELTSRLRRLGTGARTRLAAATASSPLAAQSRAWAAAESVSQLRNRTAHGLSSGPGSDLGRLAPEVLPALEELHGELLRFGDDIDALPGDSKWDAFLLSLEAQQRQLTAVFCDFAETTNYVTGRLQDAGLDAISLDDVGVFELLRRGFEGVVVARDNQLPGVDLRRARLAFNYDLPTTRRRANTRWTRLDWRADWATKMITLIDAGGATDAERVAFSQFRDLLGDRFP